MCVRGNRGRRAENGTQIGHLNGADSGVNFVQWNEEAYLRALMEGKEEEEEEERSLCIFTFPTFPKYRIISPKAKRDYFLYRIFISLSSIVWETDPPFMPSKKSWGIGVTVEFIPLIRSSFYSHAILSLHSLKTSRKGIQKFEHLLGDRLTFCPLKNRPHFSE